MLPRLMRLGGLLAAVLTLAMMSVAASATAAPLSGRWEASGGGGGRVTFTVVPMGRRQVVADVVVFCGTHGQAAFESWSEGAGPARTPLRADGRIVPLGGPDRAIQGRLARRSGVVSSAETYAGGSGCAEANFQTLRARHLGSVIARDGQWTWAGTFGSSGTMEIYGGGALIKLAGTFIGPPSPQAPEVGPCLPTLPGLFGPVFSVPTSRGGAFGVTLTSGAFGAGSRVGLTGAIASPTRVAAVYTGTLSYPGYACASAGFIVATLSRPAPPYEPIYNPQTKHNSPRPRLPRPPRQRFPRSGPERDSFRCDLRRPSAPYDLCRAYPRREGGTIRWVLLRHGDAAWGFRHIQRRRGFSRKMDAYIAATVSRGSWDPEKQRFERSFKGHGRSCRFRVVDAGDPKGVITAYVIEPGKQGQVSRCP